MSRPRAIYLKYKEQIRYIITGGFTTLVSLGTYWVVTELFLDPTKAASLNAANSISWIAAVTFAYITNRRYVFDSQNTDIKKEALQFYTARLGTLALDVASMYVMVVVIGINDRIAKLIVQVLIVIANYVLSKYIVFRKSSGPSENK